MSDTEIMRSPFGSDGDDEKLTESQVIAFKDVPKSVNRDNQQHDVNVSTIGETLHFKGELSADEDIVVEGTVEGTVNQGKCCLTVKPNGKLLANVNATKIFIEGTVRGDLSATVGVTIRESGNVKGNIVAPSVAIHEGATFNGSIDMRSPDKS